MKRQTRHDPISFQECRFRLTVEQLTVTEKRWLLRLIERKLRKAQRDLHKSRQWKQEPLLLGGYESLTVG